MSKKHSFRSPIIQRAEAPIITRDKDGSFVINCPFCKPTHPISPGMTSICGTILQVRAVQQIIRAKYDPRFVCVKCGRNGGEMVRFQNGYIHTFDCAPGVVALPQPPKYSLLAKMIYTWPNRWKSAVEKYTGRIMPVDEVQPDGTRTGNKLGYFFMKKNRGANAQRAPTGSN